ncbi:MAG: hypothetical protein NW200_08435 [Hyphomonadaceae bacterium]|nr:hypothetical protein [Hyphomonadaceae bacterium]
MKRATVALSVWMAALAWGPAAAQDAETRVYGAAQTCTGLRAYLRNYPNGRFVGDARNRIARDCPAEAAPAPVPAPKTVTPAPRPAPVDPCVQARADWAEIRDSTDIPVLRAFRDSTPATCAVQRAQAQVRIDALESQKTAAAALARKRAEWNGVPEFEGTWVLSTSGTGCSGFPWRFERNGSGFLLRYAEGTEAHTVASLSPPTLRRDNDGSMRIITGDGMMRSETSDGKVHCTVRRQ